MTIPEEEREVISNRLNRVAYHLEDGLGPNGLLGPYSGDEEQLVRGLLDDLHAVSDWLDAQPEAPEPDWDEAPNDNWLAQYDEWFARAPLYHTIDADGIRKWHWFTPICSGAEWTSYGFMFHEDSDGRAIRVHLPLGYDWRLTLRLQPGIAENDPDLSRDVAEIIAAVWDKIRNRRTLRRRPEATP